MNDDIRTAQMNPAAEARVGLAACAGNRIAGRICDPRLKFLARRATSNPVSNSVLGARGRAKPSQAQARTLRADLNVVP